MTSRDRALEFAREFKRKVARRLREEKKKAFENVVAKGEIVTWGDAFAVLDKLSRKALRSAALRRILSLSAMGFGPSQIIADMEPKKPARGGRDDQGSEGGARLLETR
jgi:hypothetical protein